MSPARAAILGAVAGAAVASAAFLLSPWGGGSREAPPAGGEDEAGPRVPPAEMAAKVRVETVREGEIEVRLPALGVVATRAAAPSRVAARTSGLVEAVEVREGAEVAAGAVLVRIDSRPARAAVARSRAGLAAAEADLRRAVAGGLDVEQSDADLAAEQARLAATQAERDATQKEALRADRLGSDRAAVQAREAAGLAARTAAAAAEKARAFREAGRAAEEARLRSAVDQAKADLEMADRDLEGTELRAPCAGRCVRLRAAVGEPVAAGDPVAEISGEGARVVRFALPPAAAVLLRPGASVLVDAGGGPPLEAVLAWTGASVDPASGLVTAEADLPAGAPGLLAGQGVAARIAVGERVRGVLLPLASLVPAGEGDGAFVVSAEHLARLVPLKVLARSGDLAVAAACEGFASGARVVVEGAFNLPDGARVQEEAAR